MKKLLTIAVIAIAAITTHAATLNWGGFVMNELDGAQTAQAGTVLALYQLSGSATAADVTGYDASTGAVTMGNGTTATLAASHEMTADEAAAWQYQGTYERADADGGVNGTWLTLIYDPSTPDGAGAIVSTVSGIADNTGSGDIVDQSWSLGASMSIPVAVPEPCSVALLALGLAAFGLKRKVA